jgi:hypothetical protein
LKFLTPSPSLDSIGRPPLPARGGRFQRERLVTRSSLVGAAEMMIVWFPTF